MANAELLPCPFCGAAPMDHAIEPHTHSPFLKELGIPDHGGSHVVECGCGAGLIDDTRAAVFARWNRRSLAGGGAGGGCPYVVQSKEGTAYCRLAESAHPQPVQVDEAWRCFHCDGTFSERDAAALHFGTREHHSPACQIDIAEYRRMEEKEARYAEEDADVHRAMYAQQSAHARHLVRAEEAGYARGLRDSGKCPCATNPQPAQVDESAQDAIDTLLNRMAGWAKAYPPDIFSEPTDEEREWLHAARPGLMDRIAASMGRHMAQCMADDLAALTAALTGAAKNE